MDPAMVRESRLASLRRRDCCILVGANVLAIALAILVGALGPPLNVTVDAAKNSSAVEWKSLTQTCSGDRPSGEPRSGPTTRCLGGQFKFNNNWVQVWELRATFNRPTDKDLERKEYDLPVNILWDVKQLAPPTWKQVADEAVLRHIFCGSGSETCVPITLIYTGSVTASEYYFEIALPVDQVDEHLTWFNTVNFQVVYRNPDFAQWEMSMKLILSVVAIVTLVLYIRTSTTWGDKFSWLCCWRAGESFTSTFSSNWIALLLILLVGFDHPLNMFEYITPGTFWAILGLLGQLSFVAGVCTFWMLELGLLATDDPSKVTFRWFFLPKIASGIIWFAVSAAFYGIMLQRESTMPLYDWTAEAPLFEATLIFVAVTVALFLLYSVILMLWVIVHYFRSVKWTWTDVSVFAYHSIVLIIIVAGFAAGVVLDQSVDQTLNFLFFHVLANAYIITLAFLYSPSTATFSTETAEHIPSQRLDGDSAFSGSGALGGHVHGGEDNNF